MFLKYRKSWHLFLSLVIPSSSSSFHLSGLFKSTNLRTSLSHGRCLARTRYAAGKCEGKNIHAIRRCKGSNLGSGSSDVLPPHATNNNWSKQARRTPSFSVQAPVTVVRCIGAPMIERTRSARYKAVESVCLYPSLSLPPFSLSNCITQRRPRQRLS